MMVGPIARQLKVCFTVVCWGWKPQNKQQP
jgi:hypothetical protein